MAHRTTLEEERLARTPKGAKKTAAGGPAKAASNEDHERIFDAFRRWGYLEATLDPLGLFEPLKHRDLDALTGEAAEQARPLYSAPIRTHFMPLPHPDRLHWFAA